MDTTTLSTGEWLEQELRFINQDMAHTLNGRMKAELVSCDDGTQTLAMSMVVYCFSRQTIPPTVSMTTNYLRPVPMEGYVEIRARLTSLGRRNATAYCEAVIPGSGKLAATAVGTYTIIQKQ